MDNSAITKIRTELQIAKKRLAVLSDTIQENETLRRDIAVATKSIDLLQKQVAEKPVQHVNTFTLNGIKELELMVSRLDITRLEVRQDLKAVILAVQTLSKELQKSIASELISTEEALSTRIQSGTDEIKKGNKTLEDLLRAWKKFKIPVPPAISFTPVTKALDDIKKMVGNIKIEWPKSATDPLAVRLSDGEEFYRVGEQIVQGIRGGGGGSGGLEIIPTKIGNGKTTSTAGTRTNLGDTSCLSVTVKALAANTGKIYVGDGSVTSANGLELSAGESVSFAVDNLAKVFINPSVSSEGVTFLYVDR